MSDAIRRFEDTLLQIFIESTEYSVKEIDRNAPDMIAETNRYKREKRESKKIIEKSQASMIQDCNRQPIKIDWFGESAVMSVVPIGECINRLQTTIETGGLLSKDIQHKLDISIDEGKITKWRLRDILWQASAQLLWHENSILTVEEIKEELLSDAKLCVFLKLNKLKCVLNGNLDSRFRALEDVIREVNPRLLRKEDSPNLTFVPIPCVYKHKNQTVNIKALRFLMGVIAKILSFKKLDFETIISHPIVVFYKSLSPSIRVFLDICVKDALDDWQSFSHQFYKK
jgi:hypothetical protein